MLVLDSALLPCRSPAGSDAMYALAEAYPSGPKAEDLVSRVRGFPRHGVNWNHQDGASAIWKTVLKLAAQTAVLRGLLNQVLNDPTVAGHHARISAIITELDADADSAVACASGWAALAPTLRCRAEGPLSVDSAVRDCATYWSNRSPQRKQRGSFGEWRSCRRHLADSRLQIVLADCAGSCPYSLADGKTLSRGRG